MPKFLIVPIDFASPILGILLIVAALMMCSRKPAHAEECWATVYSSFQTSYQYQTLAAMGSKKPVLQGGNTITCGHWWFDAWGSKDLSGRERFGNEVDLTGAYASSFQSRLGEIRYEAYASYGLVPDFSLHKDDIMELHLELARPFSLGSMTLTPYVRPIHLVGFGVYPDTDVLRSGSRFKIPLLSRLSVAGDAAVTWNLRDGVATKRLVGGFYFDAGNGLTLNAGIKLADGLEPAAFFGFSQNL